MFRVFGVFGVLRVFRAFRVFRVFWVFRLFRVCRALRTFRTFRVFRVASREPWWQHARSRRRNFSIVSSLQPWTRGGTLAVHLSRTSLPFGRGPKGGGSGHSFPAPEFLCAFPPRSALFPLAVPRRPVCCSPLDRPSHVRVRENRGTCIFNVPSSSLTRLSTFVPEEQVFPASQAHLSCPLAMGAA